MMKWFEHRTDARDNKKIRKIERHYGGGDAAMAAVGRYWRLLEIIGAQDEDMTFTLDDDYDLELLSEDLRTTVEYVQDFLNYLAEINAIDPNYLESGRVSCPKLKDRASEYAKKKDKKKIPPDNIPTMSRQCPNNIPIMSAPQDQTRPDKTRPDRKMALPKNSGSPPAYSCECFEVNTDHLQELVKAFPMMPGDYLVNDFFPRMRDWCLDHHTDAKHRKKFNPDGRLKSPRVCLKTWLRNENPDRVPKPLPRGQPAPLEPTGIVIPVRDCPSCSGGGLTKSGPCECLHPESA